MPVLRRIERKEILYISNNVNLNAAHRNRNDEFYTRYADIEKEVPRYGQYLKGKKVYCNCDDPSYSNFWKFFKDHFNEYGLDSLIITYYSTTLPPSKTVYDGHWVTQTELSGDGSFDSPECLEVLAKSDIVITNPPFSRFDDFFNTIMNTGIDFLIISPLHSFFYKDIFPYVVNDKIRAGYTGIEKFDTVNGVQKRSNTFWMTDLPVKKDIFPLTKSYNPDDYLFYDGFDYIDVGKIKDIPKDYKGIMGVPISFLPKHNPEQFKIIGEMNHGSDSIYDLGKPYVDGVLKFKKLLIQAID